MSAKQYARLVPKKHRAQRTPVIDRPMRPRMIAWAGPSAFYPNRFYEIDKWYKGRIDKPEQFPKLHTIEPTNHLHSLAEFLSREIPKHPAINIGFAPRVMPMVTVKNDEDRSKLERKSRKMELRIDYESIPFSSTTVLKHYGIFDHLFGQGVFFENVQTLDITFGDSPVFFGNTLSACATSSKPKVEIESLKAGEYNTLIMLNLDGNPFDKEGEIVHWMLANRLDDENQDPGEEAIPYLQPLPFCGTGYHRVAFVLFRHKERLNNLPKLCSGSLDERVFSMSHFYKQNEDIITPSSLLFFQTSYDISVKERLHAIGLKSPIYEYKYNEALKPEQKEFPKKPQPFDLYLDMYRDPKEVEQELLVERLRRAQLDDYEAPKWLDPNYNENKRVLPAWQHRRILAREGRYRALYDNVLKS
ncbi:phosphatidylethanolamine-binding protein [Dictyocaulus viviparus]|uniref:Phosphatidylethanolamine-binding protein n=1 Tax=Dictyocaulus viviparus TaxID=29172 RepID=A0A0D8XS28_DICVI|nr:phosphatidylethanolamine-binding protein [Dictyocaulus viviparus]